MKTELTLTIVLNTDDAAEIGRFETELKGWLDKHRTVETMAVMERGGLNVGAWRESRAETFGSSRPSPFSKAGGHS